MPHFSFSPKHILIGCHIFHPHSDQGDISLSPFYRWQDKLLSETHLSWLVHDLPFLALKVRGHQNEGQLLRSSNPTPIQKWGNRSLEKQGVHSTWISDRWGGLGPCSPAGQPLATCGHWNPLTVAGSTEIYWESKTHIEFQRLVWKKKKNIKKAQ